MSPNPLAWHKLPARSLAQDAQHRADWDRLNAARRDLPFMTSDAIVAALDVFGSGREMLAIGRAERRTVAMLVLAPQGRIGWQTFQPSQLPLGAWVAEPGVSPRAITHSLLRGPLGFCLVLSLNQVDPWLAPREEPSATSAVSDYIETGWVDVQGSFEDYWSARGKNLRQNMRKQRSKLSGDGIRLQTRVFTDPGDMAPAIERYGALESAGWKAARGTAIHLGNAQGRFYRELFETAARDGAAIVYECLFDDRTVAINLCLRRGETLVVLKTTYDESIQSFSPAFLLNQDAVEKVFGCGTIRRLEFYGRLMDWHTKWTHNKRVLYHFTAYRWPIVKRLALQRARARARQGAAVVEAPA